ncbi:hypothetical protein ACFLRF_05290 [Candidatus Altiarchaeota archaeon]
MDTRSEKVWVSGRKALYVIASFIIVSTLFSAIVWGLTSITQTDCKAEVQVRMAVYGTGVNQTVLDKWKREAETLWKGARGHQLYGDCKCKMTFKFTFIRIANASACPNNTHCIVIHERPPAGHSTSVNTGNPPGSGFDNAPFTTGSTGAFLESDGHLDIAHEIGHLMGLDDEYFRYTVNFTIRNNTVTVHTLTITYPSGTAVTNPYRQKVLAELRKKLAAGSIANGRSYVKRYDAMVPGASNNSIMAQEPGNPWVALQGHINQIATNRRVNCPNRCCCGNGVFDRGKEECEKNMTPTGCPEDKPVCDPECKCQPTPTTTIQSTTTTTQSTTTTVGGTGTGGEDGDGSGTGGDDESPPSTVKPKCTTSADCGSTTKKNICKANDVYEQTTTPLCRKGGTPDASCISKLSDRKVMDCEPGRCIAGACEGKTTSTTFPRTYDLGGCCDCPPPYGCASGPAIDADDCPTACRPYSGTFIHYAVCSQSTGNCEVIPTTTKQTTTTVQDVIMTTTTTHPPDSDGDGVIDSEDACEGYPDHLDHDGDGIPDYCDPEPIDCTAHCMGSGWNEGHYSSGECQSPQVEQQSCTYLCTYYYGLGWSWSSQKCCCSHYVVGQCTPTDGGGCVCPTQQELAESICPGAKPGNPPAAP